MVLHLFQDCFVLQMKLEDERSRILVAMCDYYTSLNIHIYGPLQPLIPPTS